MSDFSEFTEKAQGLSKPPFSPKMYPICTLFSQLTDLQNTSLFVLENATTSLPGKVPAPKHYI